MSNVTQLFKEAEKAVEQTNDLGDMLRMIARSQQPAPTVWYHACPDKEMDAIPVPLGMACCACHRDQDGNYPEGAA